MDTNLTVPDHFLWGASTSSHQTEGGNVHSDWWRIENLSDSFLPERSGDAVDSYHRYAQDMRLLADAGLNAYRFSVEWARVEPAEGAFVADELCHYRDMIDTAIDFGLTPVVTLHHFTSPAWFSDRGGWLHPAAADTFARYVEHVATILSDVKWVCTINEPNVLASAAVLMRGHAKIRPGGSVARETKPGFVLPLPDDEVAKVLAVAHRRAVDIVHAATQARAGWTVAGQQLVSTPGNEALLEKIRWSWEDRFLSESRGDDFVGVQAYTSQQVDNNGIVAHPPRPDNTLSGWAYRPDALEMALRHFWEVTGGTPMLVTENGIATDDDTVRIAYTRTALDGMQSAINDGLDVRGYLHWSALDNYEWGQWGPTFGLIAVDRATFARIPRPSLAWLGRTARSASTEQNV